MERNERKNQLSGVNMMQGKGEGSSNGQKTKSVRRSLDFLEEFKEISLESVDLLRAMELEGSEVDEQEFQANAQEETIDDDELIHLLVEWVDKLDSQRREQSNEGLLDKELAKESDFVESSNPEECGNQWTQPSEDVLEKTTVQMEQVDKTKRGKKTSLGSDSSTKEEQEVQ
jgi:hypothetical protein